MCRRGRGRKLGGVNSDPNMTPMKPKHKMIRNWSNLSRPPKTAKEKRGCAPVATRRQLNKRLNIKSTHRQRVGSLSIPVQKNIAPHPNTEVSRLRASGTPVFVTSSFAKDRQILSRWANDLCTSSHRRYHLSTLSTENASSRQHSTILPPCRGA